MKRQVFMLRFSERGGIFYPEDAHLHRLACLWADANLAQKINFTDYSEAWVECTVGEEGQPIAVEGLLCLQRAVDCPVLRFTNAASAKLLIQRANDYLQDRGARGQNVFVHISDNEEECQRCPEWKDWIETLQCKPAERYLYKVR